MNMFEVVAKVIGPNGNAKIIRAGSIGELLNDCLRVLRAKSAKGVKAALAAEHNILINPKYMQATLA